jgi:hypothetical protein
MRSSNLPAAFFRKSILSTNLSCVGVLVRSTDSTSILLNQNMKRERLIFLPFCRYNCTQHRNWLWQHDPDGGPDYSVVTPANASFEALASAFVTWINWSRWLGGP